MSVTQNPNRPGNFTSSAIAALTTQGKTKDSFGKTALTYIAEKNMERRLGKCLDTDSKAKPLAWGKLLEPIAFDLLPLDYTLCSQDTIPHPKFDFWLGSPDLTKPGTVSDIKCPYTLKSFCQLVEPLYNNLQGMDAMNHIREHHQDGEKFYWQLVSNSILTNSPEAELIVYMPYESTLSDIKSAAEGNPDCYWIWAALDGELPCLPDGGYYKDVNIISFTVPQEDEDHLTACVEKAGNFLIDRAPSVLIAHHDPDVGATIIE